MAITETDRPFDDIRRLFTLLPGPDQAARGAVRAREAELIKPAGALGRLEEISEWLAAWQGKSPPTVERARVAVFVSSHGVAERGVSAYPPTVTKQVLEALMTGKAAINQICKTFDLGLSVLDLAAEMPTADMTKAPAMDERMCTGTMAFGMEAVAGGIDLLCLGEMGIGNTTVAAAIFHALWGERAEDWVGPGTGLDAAGLAKKAAVVAEAVSFHRAHLDNPLEVLRRLGGRDVAAMAGAILAARLQRVPVLLDGFVVTAAAAVLHAFDPHAIDHCRAAHRSAETAHAKALARLGLRPLLDLEMRLGEGTGAALAASLAKAATACHSGMATFAEAGVDTA